MLWSIAQALTIVAILFNWNVIDIQRMSHRMTRMPNALTIVMHCDDSMLLKDNILEYKALSFFFAIFNWWIEKGVKCIPSQDGYASSNTPVAYGGNKPVIALLQTSDILWAIMSLVLPGHFTSNTANRVLASRKPCAMSAQNPFIFLKIEVGRPRNSATDGWSISTASPSPAYIVPAVKCSPHRTSWIAAHTFATLRHSASADVVNVAMNSLYCFPN